MANCVDCNTPESVPKSEVLYAQGEPGTRNRRKYYQLPEPVSGYALYHCDDEYKTGFYVIKPKAANNLVSNPTFFMDLDGWSVFNGVIKRTNDIAFDSGFSLRINGSGDVITAERREYAEISTTEFLAGQSYVFSMYAWAPMIWDVSDILSLTISIADDLGNEIFSEPVSKPGQWERLVVSTIIDPGATELFLRVNLRSQDQRENQPPYNLTGDFNLASEYAYFDMGQFELGVSPTTPFHGDTSTCASCEGDCDSGGYSWNGVAHQSSSIRSSCAKDGGELVCLSDLGFEVTSHSGHGAPPIRDLSFPLNNRAGEFYQRSVADARILTFTGQLCDTTLKDLECAVHELGQHIFPDLSPCSCCGRFLLIYHHEECDNNACDPERDLAICVTYIGGLEGVRTNHYLQQAAIQFKAHDPFWFEWPGHSSQGLSYSKVVQTPNAVRIRADGSAVGIPISELNEYTSIACRPGLDSVAIGGTFESIDGDPDRCEANVAIWDCDEWIDLCLGFVGDGINQMTSDDNGNTLVAGSFAGPCTNVAIIYEDGSIGCFPGYPGGEAFSIAAPYWAQAIVGDANGIYALDFDGNWQTWTTDGIVRDFAIDSAGNFYAVGDFTQVDGVDTGNIAFFNANASDACLDLDNIEVEGSGFTFNGQINSVDINEKTGVVYFGGDFTQATPIPVDICDISQGLITESNGSNQQLHFTDLGGGVYSFEVYYLNIITRNQAEQCFNDGNYIRVTGQSSVGQQYNFFFGAHNTALLSTNTVVVGPDTFYTIEFSIDTNAALTGSCATLTDEVTDELTTSNDFMALLATLTLPGGLGVDNTLTKLTAQCVTLTTSFTGDVVDLNYVAQFSGGNVSAMADGVLAPVNAVAVDQSTGEVYIGTELGLRIWNGFTFFEFPGLLGGSSFPEILDLKFCDDCSILILFSNTGASVVPGINDVFYNGTAQPVEFDLLIHGPGTVRSFKHNGSNNGMRLCTVLQCDEVARLNFINGRYDSNVRNNLLPSVLGGSRYDICLGSCDNDIGVYIDDDGGKTKATLLWKRSFMGIESLCCLENTSSLQAGGSATSQAVEDCINTEYLAMHRPPDEDDCENSDLSPGDLWGNLVGCPSLHLFTGGCGDCPEFEGAYTGSEGAPLTNADGEPYCYDVDLDCP